MNELKDLYRLFSTHPQTERLTQFLQKSNQSITVSGLVGSSMALALAACHERLQRTVICVTNEQELAAYAYQDASQARNTDDVVYFPSSFRFRSDGKTVADSLSEVMRTDVLNRLSSSDTSPLLLFTYHEALIEMMVSKKSLQRKVRTLHTGDVCDTEQLIDDLLENGFQRVDFVYEPGQFSQRGSILDVFSYSNDMPFRLDFFGNEIDSIRLFNIETQLSETTKDSISIVPDIREMKGVKETVSISDFLPHNAIFVFDDLRFVTDRMNHCAKDMEGALSGDAFLDLLRDFSVVHLKNGQDEKANVCFHTHLQPLYHKNFDLVADSFRKFLDEGYSLNILSDSKKQTDRIRAIFEDKELNLPFTPILKTLHDGFYDDDLHVCVFTDHQIFDRYHKYSLRGDQARNGKVVMTLKELNELKVGDYVTHIDHGVGRFGGLLKMDAGGHQQEVIKLLYRDNDTIFVNIHNLHRIAKYKGRDGVPPKVNKLGSGAWERLKERTKKKVKDIARDLIRLYARRKAEKGFAFSPDTYLQKELEASFLYEDTPDQSKATQDVKADMERSLPMDRLVCGDVGFGKTEVAMRAAFKAVTDGKQVAVLVPTTVLALQHYKSFCDRMKNFPCSIDYLSRARSAGQTKDVLTRLAQGKIDIIIGTHILVGKRVKFKDLGLLIVDEEQKFGVSVKERLKAMKVNVDTLTLTATPIPRTLQFSLMGARDLSIISTPPPNRYPIQTELAEFGEEVIREAVVREMNRNGQVFIINNRIHNIYDLQAFVHRVVPEARIAVGHGQMDSEKLEQVILDFVDYEYDVLIATTIIESGIDIPNANTIIINDAQNFGLSDLHQLRGRVGRSNRKAYCYLLSPPMSVVTPEARRRLQAIETFSSLGSGFQIAMQDLDIRGAGNMLGAEQSGFIADLGYETYQKILSEAVHELKDEEFSELYRDEKGASEGEENFASDCLLESDLSLMIPTLYVESVSERMSLYRELDGLVRADQLDDFAHRLEDRFGPVPPEVRDLFTALRVRWLGMRLGFERLSLKRGMFIGYMVSNLQSSYYRSDVFGAVLSYVAAHPLSCRLREDAGKRSVSVKDIKTIDQAYDLLNEMISLVSTSDRPD
ncbi:MAG: transcription-repair coupling factor [Paludibacteraceae bacterium]|nr:transcription-repair coupling factor [Paludibacteraceae bacterium]